MLPWPPSPISVKRLATIPISAVQNELADLCGIPGAQSQAAPFENAALQIPRPFEVGDTERLEQEFARDVIECPASRVSNDSLQKQSPTTVVVPDLSRRHRNGLFEHVPTSIGGRKHTHCAVLLDRRKERFVSFEARGHRQEMAQRNALFLRGVQVGVLRKKTDNRIVNTVLLISSRSSAMPNSHEITLFVTERRPCLLSGP